MPVPQARSRMQCRPIRQPAHCSLKVAGRVRGYELAIREVPPASACELPECGCGCGFGPGGNVFDLEYWGRCICRGEWLLLLPAPVADLTVVLPLTLDISRDAHGTCRCHLGPPLSFSAAATLRCTGLVLGRSQLRQLLRPFWCRDVVGFTPSGRGYWYSPL
jgi:hypothetical protein